MFRFGLQQSCITPECSARRGVSPSHLSGFQGYGALAGFNAYVFSEGNRQSGKFAWNRRRLSIM
ncbi:hypothetical protein HMPREF1616_03717 [Escherichia coli 908658]|nr:hypothetical protein HMPREF1616_03717 [Escherichia coli 908658]